MPCPTRSTGDSRVVLIDGGGVQAASVWTSWCLLRRTDPREDGEVDFPGFAEGRQRKENNKGEQNQILLCVDLPPVLPTVGGGSVVSQGRFISSTHNIIPRRYESPS